MATRFQVKRSSVSGVTPTTSDIQPGELAINLADKKLFTANSSAVFELGSNLTNLSVSSNLTVKGIIANGSLGTAGHVLHSNGTATYWAADDQGVTSVATGNGLTGGTITSTGTVSVHANNGITANATGLYVTQGTGTVVNATGVHVNSTYIGTLSANSATYANGSITNTFTVGTSTYFVSNGNVGIGTSSPGSKLDIVAQDAIRITGFQPFQTWLDSSDGNKGFSIQTAGGQVLFRNDATGSGTYTERMRIDSSGNVGIGNTAPTHKVRVEGDISLSGGIHANGSFGTSGQVLTSNGSGVYWSTVSGGSGSTETLNPFLLMGA